MSDRKFGNIFLAGSIVGLVQGYIWLETDISWVWRFVISMLIYGIGRSVVKAIAGK